MSYEEFQEELFNHCLNELEYSDSTQTAPLTGTRFPSAIPDSIFHLINPPGDPLLLAQICINCSRFDVIKVMKSGIFYRGGLKGAPLTRHHMVYKTYYFNDLIYSILMITSYLVKEDPKEYLRYYNDAFERSINQIDRLQSISYSYGSKRNWNALIKIKNRLKEIKIDLLQNPVVALPSRFNEKDDCIDLLICLFRRQLPPATPDLTISTAISTLLRQFNIFAEPEAIRQRIIRAKQK